MNYKLRWGADTTHFYTQDWKILLCYLLYVIKISKATWTLFIYFYSFKPFFLLYCNGKVYFVEILLLEFANIWSTGDEVYLWLGNISPGQSSWTPAEVKIMRQRNAWLHSEETKIWTRDSWCACACVCVCMYFNKCVFKWEKLERQTRHAPILMISEPREQCGY